MPFSLPLKKEASGASSACSMVKCPDTGESSAPTSAQLNRFCKCFGGSPFELHCPEGLHFDEPRQKCSKTIAEEQNDGSERVKRDIDSAFRETFGLAKDEAEFRNLSCGQRIHNEVRADAVIVGSQLGILGAITTGLFGATQGVALGSVVPGLGNVIGGIVGFIAGAVSGGAIGGAVGAGAGVLHGAVTCIDMDDPYKYSEGIAEAGEVGDIFRKHLKGSQG